MCVSYRAEYVHDVQKEWHETKLPPRDAFKNQKAKQSGCGSSSWVCKRSRAIEYQSVHAHSLPGSRSCSTHRWRSEGRSGIRQGLHECRQDHTIKAQASRTTTDQQRQLRLPAQQCLARLALEKAPLLVSNVQRYLRCSQILRRFFRKLCSCELPNLGHGSQPVELALLQF